MPTGLASAVKVGFWVSMADASGNKVTADTEIYPAPTRVDYPNAELGEAVETADGRVVFQVSSADPRRRAWIWNNYGPEILSYERQYQFLDSLKARYRYARGLSPFIYVFDGTTRRLDLNRRVRIGTPITVSGTSVTIPNIASLVADGYLKNAVLEILPATTNSSPAVFERRTVLAAATTTNTILTLNTAFSSNTLNNSTLLLSWSQPVWWKVRVLDTTRELRTEGGPPRYTESKFQFVLDDDVAETQQTLGTIS